MDGTTMDGTTMDGRHEPAASHACHIAPRPKMRASYLNPPTHHRRAVRWKVPRAVKFLSAEVPVPAEDRCHGSVPPKMGAEQRVPTR